MSLNPRPNQKFSFKKSYLSELEDHRSAEKNYITPLPYPKHLITYNSSINAEHLESHVSATSSFSVKPKHFHIDIKIKSLIHLTTNPFELVHGFIDLRKEGEETVANEDNSEVLTVVNTLRQELDAGNFPPKSLICLDGNLIQWSKFIQKN